LNIAEGEIQPGEEPVFDHAWIQYRVSRSRAKQPDECTPQSHRVPFDTLQG
jgi:hypothetical protein